MYKRFEVRKGKKIMVDIISKYWDEPISFESVDISPRGLFVKTYYPLEPGEIVVVCFKLTPYEREFIFFGEVVRAQLTRRKSDYGTPGMAIQFKDITPYERLLIREALRNVPPPLPRIIELTQIKSIGVCSL